MIILIILVTIVLVYFIIKSKLKKVSNEFFGTSDIKQAIKTLELEASNTPKSLSGMEAIYLPQIKKDFEDLNINELKSLSESNIIKCLTEINDRYEDTQKNEKIKYWIEDRINKNINYTSIKIHKTILSKYKKNDTIATIYFQTSLEYVYKDNTNSKKVQTRFETEFVHVIDSEKLKEEEKVLSINCPNCGAPIKNVKESFCEYCNCGIIDIVKKVWIFNNIREF